MLHTETTKERPTPNPDPRRRVLIVDDMRQVRQELRVLLELTGAIEIVGEAADGREALELTDRLVPDVVLMDLVMPEMDGYTATRRIKTQHPTLRVVILSVHGDEASLQQAYAAGADAFIVKGAPLEKLVQLLVDDSIQTPIQSKGA